MRKVIISLFFVIGLVVNILGNIAYASSIESNIGFEQIQHITVPATYVASPMDVKIILPESYATSTDKKYPVVYFLIKVAVSVSYSLLQMVFFIKLTPLLC